MAPAGAGEAVTAEELLAAARGIMAQSESCWAVSNEPSRGFHYNAN